MTSVTAQDILEADQARRSAKSQPLLTVSGRRVLRNLAKVMQPLSQSELDEIARHAPKLGGNR